MCSAEARFGMPGLLDLILRFVESREVAQGVVCSLEAVGFGMLPPVRPAFAQPVFGEVRSSACCRHGIRIVIALRHPHPGPPATEMGFQLSHHIIRQRRIRFTPAAPVDHEPVVVGFGRGGGHLLIVRRI